MDEIVLKKQKQFAQLSEYQKILCTDMPDFLEKYIQLPILQRLAGVGLLCGTDWTPLYDNKFFYTRLDHSIGVALLIWRFTQNKKETIAGLLHDVSTPSFSHVSDFLKGDTMTQKTTENKNRYMIINDVELGMYLNGDGLYSGEVADYHRYSIADNELPQLSADRLEYMFPSGMALQGNWTQEEIQRTCDDIKLLLDEHNVPEIGFGSLEIAEAYCQKVCSTGLILQKNENKLTLQLMAEIIRIAEILGIIDEKDLFRLSEEELMERFAGVAQKTTYNKVEQLFSSYFRTFISMTRIEHTNKKTEDCFCVQLDVKKRYINPLVQTGKNTGKRIAELSPKAAQYVKDFLAFNDTTYGCVQLVHV